jgi:integration host factor subunit alpha
MARGCVIRLNTRIASLDFKIKMKRPELDLPPSQYALRPTKSKPTLTKVELVALLCKERQLDKHEAKKMVEVFFALISDTLEKGQNVKLAGFGNFQLRDKPQRPGRNLQTGEPISIAARRVVTFRASAKLKARLDVQYTHLDEQA